MISCAHATSCSLLRLRLSTLRLVHAGYNCAAEPECVLCRNPVRCDTRAEACDQGGIYPKRPLHVSPFPMHALHGKPVGALRLLPQPTNARIVKLYNRPQLAAIESCSAHARPHVCLYLLQKNLANHSSVDVGYQASSTLAALSWQCHTRQTTSSSRAEPVPLEKFLASTAC